MECNVFQDLIYSVSLAIGLSIIKCNRIKQDVRLQSEYVFFINSLRKKKQSEDYRVQL